MFFNRPFDRARHPAPRFLLGAVFGAMFVVSFAGAGLTLAGVAAGHAPALEELRLDRVPRPAPALGRLA